METKTITQTAIFEASPIEVYNLIMDEKKHAAFTGFDVKMSKKVNGKFDIYNGYILGYNIELVEGEKIIQAWHFAEDGWPDDHYSICTFKFKKLDNKTKLTLQQTDVPAHKVEELSEGWRLYYWKPMKALLKKQQS